MKSPLAYVGGKSKLAPQIVDLIPDHQAYYETFFGGGWVFFRKEPSRVEVINDLDRDLVAFYRVVQNHLEEFSKQFKWLLSSREWFEDWKQQLEGRGLTDIQRAARYYYLQRLCFGGKVRGRTFGVAVDRQPRINLLRLEEELSEVHLRLVNTTIECLSWEEFIPRYDRPGTFFYLDPPYYSEPVYKHNFHSIEDYARLATLLSQVKGQWILSINDHPEIRSVFKAFHIKPVRLKYTVGRDNSIDGRELLVTNYKI
ncbi:MAG TPA: DNA adenine methylase [Spirochaetota bacterium]|nr:DNA adenine methylase [Spirochaetota bacterium]HPO44232.1 DNA adenine methylase [Spirochaetota bacterium]